MIITPNLQKINKCEKKLSRLNIFLKLYIYYFLNWKVFLGISTCWWKRFLLKIPLKYQIIPEKKYQIIEIDEALWQLIRKLDKTTPLTYFQWGVVFPTKMFNHYELFVYCIPDRLRIFIHLQRYIISFGGWDLLSQ